MYADSHRYAAYVCMHDDGCEMTRLANVFRLSARLIPAIALQVMGHAYVTHATCVGN
jgi:hypothetical protein